MTTGKSRPRRRFRLGNSPLDIIRDAAAVSLPAPVLSAQHASLDTGHPRDEKARVAVRRCGGPDGRKQDCSRHRGNSQSHESAPSL